VARIDALGHVNKTLVGVAFNGDTLPTIGDELTANGQPAGRVTSATFSPKLHSPLALAYVRRGNNALGNTLQWQDVKGRVVKLPAQTDGESQS
jgi:glycine cleavage system aminomethyltransferase T